MWKTGDDRIAVKDRGLCLDLKGGKVLDPIIQTYKCTDGNPNQVFELAGLA